MKLGFNMIKYDREKKKLVIPNGLGRNAIGGGIQYVGGTNIDIDGNVINCTIDTSDFVSEDKLDEAISEVEGKIPSLEGYATEDYVDNKVSEVEGKIPSVEGFATKEYVDDIVGDINAILATI